MIKIAEDKITCISVDEINSLFSDKVDIKSVRRKYKNITETLGCFFEESQARIIFAIGILKISTPYEIQNILGISSRNPVSNHLIKAHRCGLVEVINRRHFKYDLIMDVWKKMHLSTNKQPPIFIATDKLNKLIELFSIQKNEILSNEEIVFLEARRSRYDKIYAQKTIKIKKQDKKRAKEAIEIVGSCVKCDKAIKKQMIENNMAEKVKDSLYCKECIKEMMMTGELSDILKNK